MAEIFVTVSVEAKDKLEATAIVRDRMQCAYCSDIVGVSTDNPYKIIDELEDKLDKWSIYG